MGEVAEVTAPDVGGDELDGARQDPRQEGFEVIGDRGPEVGMGDGNDVERLTTQLSAQGVV